MNFKALWFTFGVVSVIALIAMGGKTAAPDASAQSAKPAACLAPEYRQFDFWAGDWDAFDVADPSRAVARARVDRILGGCVLREDYESTDGMKGQSFTIYDASRKVWHQSWVTNGGRLLVIDGTFRDGKMTLSGKDRTAEGKERQVRGIWKSADGGVRETAVTSLDGGNTWQPWFDLMFRPHVARSSANAPAANDRVAIAALDTEYQAAVKKNDSATMDRLLADDFILVVGSGKTYTKADLLNDARGGLTIYEHQEDTEQTVRIWGDTAVITAKLWEKGTDNGKPFDSTLWFSDTYVRTPAGWRYVFGQASSPLPKR